MDHLFEIDNIKTEKGNAMRKFTRIKNIANFFRMVEICLVLMFLSWVSTNHLSNLLNCLGEHLHNFSVFIAKPKFVFLVGNAIILTLFAKSGNNSSSSSQSSISNGFAENTHHDLYDEFIKNSNKKGAVSKTEAKEEEIVFQDKETVIEEEYGDVMVRNPVVITTPTGDLGLMNSDKRNYRRSKSENSKNHRVYEKQSLRKLRRSETEKYRDVEDKKISSCEDIEMMSNDELRKKVEDFIAKQMRFHREESMTIVLPKTKNGY